MIGKLMELGGFGVEAVVTLTRNGLLRPLPPRVLARVVEAYRTFDVSLAAGVAAAAARWPERPAVLDEDGALTFAELDARSAALAAGLRSRYGAGPGTTVAVMWPNHRGFVLAAAAVSRLGVDLLLLNTGLAGPQLRDVLRREGVHVLVADPGLARVPFGGPRVSDLDELVREGGPPVPRPRRPGRLVLLTSGTTGAPKGAPRRLSLGAVAEPFVSMLATVPVRGGEPMLIAPPLFHGLGILWYAVALALGCPVVLMRRFDPPAVLDALERTGAGGMVAVPVMLQRLLALPPRRLPHLRVVVSGGSALRPDLATAFMDAYGDVLHNLYGSTETGWAALATPADLRAAPGTVGRPPRGATVRIEGPGGREQPVGEVGRVMVGGGLTFGTAPRGEDGLLAAGDLGHRDERGLLFIDGRDDDMIVSGGENVFPQEVENLLARRPGVADVAVLGVPDEEFGQRPAAYVVAEEGVTLSAEELKQAVKEELAGFKVPRDVVFVPSLPRNQTGKVDRSRLLEDSRS
ncbi:AMP-binding protein [Nonomuraea aridisoli]|nr:AMP-binding protein [Nonomuraea aridisoli]